MTSVRDRYTNNGMTSRQARKFLEKENRKYSDVLQRISTGPHPNPHYIGSYRSKNFLVQIFDEPNATRLSINRTTLARGGDHWDEDITWDELQEIKKQCGFGDRCAVEVFPPEGKVVNVANMRHLFILDQEPNYMWSK